MDDSIIVNHRREALGLLGSALNNPLFLLSLQIIAFWYVWQSIGARFATSGEAMWEMLPLLSVFFFAWLAGPKQDSHTSSLTLMSAAAFISLYAVSFSFAPPMLRAVFAIISLTLIISSWRFNTFFHFGIFILFLLSLPLTDSLNFFLGYPMRALVGEVVAFLLNLQGLDVYREGLSLRFGDKLIWIDAPCSGIKMLWFGTFLATFLSFPFKLGTFRLLGALSLTFIAIVLGNIMRASALFYLEAGLIDASEWMHSAIGVVAFAITSLVIVFVVKKLSGSKWKK